MLNKFVPDYKLKQNQKILKIYLTFTDLILQFLYKKRLINCSSSHQTEGINCGMFICYYSACYLFGNGKETILALPPSSKAMFNLRKTIAIKLHTQKVFPKTLPKKLPSNVSSTEQSAESVLKALEDLKENLPREVKETLIFSAGTLYKESFPKNFF